jgi:hypothetical protein
VEARIFTFPCRADRLWGPPNLLYNGYRVESGRGVKLTTHLQLVPRSRKCGSIHPFPHTPSWRSAYLVKHRDNVTLLYYIQYANFCTKSLFFLENNKALSQCRRHAGVLRHYATSRKVSGSIPDQVTGFFN